MNHCGNCKHFYRDAVNKGADAFTISGKCRRKISLWQRFVNWWRYDNANRMIGDSCEGWATSI